MTVVLDTCAWIWHVAGDRRLSPRAREAIGESPPPRALVVSVFSCWEVAKLVEKRKLRLSLPVREWLSAAVRQPGIVLEPVTMDICVDSTVLPGEFHSDPADQIIVATARRLNLPLITIDARIRAYSHVTTIW